MAPEHWNFISIWDTLPLVLQFTSNLVCCCQNYHHLSLDFYLPFGNNTALNRLDDQLCVFCICRHVNLWIMAADTRRSFPPFILKVRSWHLFWEIFGVCPSLYPFIGDSNSSRKWFNLGLKSDQIYLLEAIAMHYIQWQRHGGRPQNLISPSSRVKMD